MNKYLSSLLVLCMVVSTLWWFNRPLQVSELSAPARAEPGITLVQNTHQAPPLVAEQGAATQNNTQILPEDLDQEAISSLAEARITGDSRAPQMHASAPRLAPPDNIIRDEIAYAAYEIAEQKKMYRAYVDAALPKVRELQALIDTARQRGDIPEQDIQQAQDKISGILHMREQLLRENPDLMQPEYAHSSHTAADNTVPLNADGL